MRIDILQNGDKVINVTPDFVAVERKSHEVDIIPVISDGCGFRVDIENITTIGFGNNIVHTGTDNGISLSYF